MKRVARFVSALDRVLTQAVAIAACAGLVVAVGSGFWQVVTRFVLSDPAVWSEALVRLSLIWAVLLGFAVALREGALVSIDLFEQMARGRLRAVVRLGLLLSNLIVCGILGGYGATMAMRVARQTMAGLEISIAWGYAAIPVGCGLAALAVLARHSDEPNIDGVMRAAS